MLSGDERRIFHEIESQLVASTRHAREHLIIAARAAALVCAASTLLTATILTAAGWLLPAYGAPVTAVAGAITGWQLLSHTRRHAIGPRLRHRLGRRDRRSRTRSRPAPR